MSTAASFEFFPPRTEAARTHLWGVLERLAGLGPAFVSVTYGAGGSTQAETLATLCAIATTTSVPVAGHLTCVGRSRAEVDATVRDYWDAGVRHIIALRGDMPEPGASFRPHPNGYDGTPPMIAAIRAIAPFEISVATYPETHPERSPADDLALLGRKVEAGATRAITQFCFATEQIVALRERVERAGIDVTIVPGIMPATNFAAVARMAARCGASVPAWLAASFEGLDEDPQARALLAAICAARQVEELRCEGFEQFHFYTLNQADVVGAVCRLLDLRPRLRELDAA